MEFQKKKRLKDGNYDKEEILQLFMKLLSGEEGTEVQEFVIVAKGVLDGEATTDVFSTMGSTAEVIGLLEMGKLLGFEHRNG